MDEGIRGRARAGTLAVLAAFLWATYYLFVLAVSPGTRPSAVLAYPFIGGAIAFVGWTVVHRDGRALVRLFASPAAYLRVALLVGTQASILAATFLTGPVDASLLSLLGDVVATPVLVAVAFGGDRDELGSPLVLTGMGLSLAGGTLAILGGHRLSAVTPVAWLAVVSLPVTVAFYFVLSARSGASAPVNVVVAQTMVGAAVVSVALSPLLPGGAPALVSVGAAPLALLLVNGLASFFVAYLLYFGAITRAGLVFPPMLMTGIPVFTLLLSAAVLRIAPTPLALLGVPIAVVGGLVALVAGARAAAAPSTPP